MGLKTIAARMLAASLEETLNAELHGRGPDAPEGTNVIEVSETLMREIVKTLRGDD